MRNTQTGRYVEKLYISVASSPGVMKLTYKTLKNALVSDALSSGKMFQNICTKR